jgi:hypothetical protein
MPTLVADVRARPEAIADALVRAGWSWQHPHSGAISVFASQGERLVVASAQAALEEFQSGALLQLWLGDGGDLAIGRVGDSARIYFDGLTAHHVAQCLDALARHGIDYRVDTE